MTAWIILLETAQGKGEQRKGVTTKRDHKRWTTKRDHKEGPQKRDHKRGTTKDGPQRGTTKEYFTFIIPKNPRDFIRINLHNTSDSLRNRNGITCLCERPCMVSHINEGMPKSTRKDTCVNCRSLSDNSLVSPFW